MSDVEEALLAPPSPWMWDAVFKFYSRQFMKLSGKGYVAKNLASIGGWLACYDGHPLTHYGQPQEQFEDPAAAAKAVEDYARTLGWLPYTERPIFLPPHFTEFASVVRIGPAPWEVLDESGRVTYPGDKGGGTATVVAEGDGYLLVFTDASVSPQPVRPYYTLVDVQAETKKYDDLLRKLNRKRRQLWHLADIGHRVAEGVLRGWDSGIGPKHL